MRLPPSLVILRGILHVESLVLFLWKQMQRINCFTDQNNQKNWKLYFILGQILFAC